MWISELARRADVPVATVKFYLREGLLPSGQATGATRAVYDQEHVRRLRLIRALVDVGGLSLADVRRVLDAVEDETAPLHDVLGTVQAALAQPGPEPSEQSRARVDGLVATLGWQVREESTNRDTLARALDALEDVGEPLSDEALADYAHALAGIAALEVPTIDVASHEVAVRQVVVRTVLIDPVLLTLRRMAHEDFSPRSRSG